ncbi:Hypothetical predicted protein [Marmota monax]|uniref:Proline-rich protein 9 n=1 Tax=Marmota monax TaxID=9995 RepID=A0A5E4A7R7_MARMO|nr:Hypothetical predicted protein [Marmota monax]
MGGRERKEKSLSTLCSTPSPQLTLDLQMDPQEFHILPQASVSHRVTKRGPSILPAPVLKAQSPTNHPKMSFSGQQCKQPCAPPPCLQKTQERCQAQAEVVCLPPRQDPCQEKCPAQAQEVCLPQCQELSQENCPQQGQDPCLPPCQDQCLPQCVEPCQEPAQTKCVEVCPQKVQEKCSSSGKGK